MALRFAKPGEELTVLHVDDPERASSVSYWRDECSKIALFGHCSVNLLVLPKRRSITETILDHINGASPAYGLVVVGSVELANPQKKIFLGSGAPREPSLRAPAPETSRRRIRAADGSHHAPSSRASLAVSQAVAKRCAASTCVIKNFTTT